MGRKRLHFPQHVDDIDDYLYDITDWPDKLQETLSLVIDQLVRLLHQLPDYSIKEIIKGGSLGKGTAMKKGSDIDLIVFFNEYNNIEELIADKHQIIDDIFNYFDDLYIHQFQYMSFVRKNNYLIQYEIRLFNSNRSFHLDILPAMPVLDDHYSPNDLLSVYKEMEFKQEYIRSHYSACFAKIQRKMMQNKPNNVHDLIYLLKSWKNRFHVPIKSYCCEVIGMFVHYKWFDEEECFDVSEAFVEAMRFLSRYKTLYVALPFYYKIKRWKRHFPDKPYILDPVNPFSDTTDRTLDEDKMDKIEKCATTTFIKFKSENEYQHVSMEQEDKATTQLIPTPQWPRAIKCGPHTNGYLPVSMELEDKATTQFIPTTQWPQAITNEPQTKYEHLLEEGGFAANRRKSPTSGCKCCLVIALLVIVFIVLIVLVGILVYTLKKQ
ncbi:2'-5'-oligoadenylate synthase 2 isoform X1 [Patella vulgata]|uniref:2'-5'-oligoadenylate synthase 2 isoform X1 n=1 Tax=Patella vulgata TaxID=6465 RepID=UPI0024A8BDD6|nr:2'-5'-oligoadenylate synthase 2 isoform X1 [Patella vulgata]